MCTSEPSGPQLQLAFVGHSFYDGSVLHARHPCIWKCAASSGGNLVERGKARQTDMALGACLQSRGSHIWMHQDEKETGMVQSVGRRPRVGARAGG